MAKLVRIKHPEIEGETTVTEAYFERLKAKGWQRADAPPAPATPVPDAAAPQPVGELPPVPDASAPDVADAFGADPSIDTLEP